MKKIFTIAAAALIASGFNAFAQDLMTNATAHVLGEAKTWTGATETYTFEPDLLEDKAVFFNQNNGRNIYLFPEGQNGGGFDTEANREIGIQGFYVDLGAEYELGFVETTWEGAACDAYDIYVTNIEPTLDILNTEATVSETGLGQYTQHTTMLPDDTKGRYVVFQGTKATNWGWGVKIRSITISAPITEIKMETFTVHPVFVFEENTPLTFTVLDQVGRPIPFDEVEITEGGGTYNQVDKTITLAQGETATFTAKYGDTELEFTVSAPNDPELPVDPTTDIYTQEHQNVQWEYGYNAPSDEQPTQKREIVTFDNGRVATQFHSVYCIFFYNKETMTGAGAWNNIGVDPTTYGKYLNMQVYSSRETECYISFNDNTPRQFPFHLVHDTWNQLSVDMEEVPQLTNMSIRFPEVHDLDCVMLASIYFSDKSLEEEVVASLTPTFTTEGNESVDPNEENVLGVKDTDIIVDFSAQHNAGYQIFCKFTPSAEVQVTADDTYTQLEDPYQFKLEKNVSGTFSYYMMHNAEELPTVNITVSGNDIPTGVAAVAVENDVVNVYTTTGLLVKKGVNSADALNGLSKGLYIVGGKKVMVK